MNSNSKSGGNTGEEFEQIEALLCSLKCDKVIPANATLNDIGVMIISLNKSLNKKNNEIKKLESQIFYLKENENVELLHEHNR